MNVHLECFHGNKSIPCEDDSLISGSRVRSSCKQAHKYENYKNTYQEINCGEDGKWDAALIPCISGCEKKPESHEAPWHVIIVHNNYEKGQSCFGTVVSPRLILTAESCLFLEVSITGSEGSDANATHYSVLVARYPDYQRFYEVAEFQYFNQTKFSNNWNRGLTPMIVVLKEKLEFNSFVSPAHIQWENQKKLDMWNGTVKVSATVELPSDLENDLTEILHTRPTTNSVNFSSHIACKERWTYPYFALYWAAKLKSYKETIDKTFLYDKNLMCLEFDEDSTLNIGSGVVVEDNNCNYFLRGIMGYPLDLAQLISRMNTHLGLNDGFSNNFNKFRKCANKRIPPKWSNVEESFKFWCNITNLVMKTTRKIGNKLENDPKIAGFLDIADYVGWIKKVRDEIENK
ncbi:uncharacterized protein LOC135847298 [Planococcus citri]|uniref:uncharacterized protein LOC135847298 n=1 Tax=Planococcus citri TaxID=170843 RepID=UPI0031F9A645